MSSASPRRGAAESRQPGKNEITAPVGLKMVSGGEWPQSGIHHDIAESFMNILKSSPSRQSILQKTWFNRTFGFLLNFPGLESDPAVISNRLRRHLSRGEFFGLALSIAFVGIFLWLMKIGAGGPADLQVYLAGRASPMFYYGYWSLPFFTALNHLPLPLAYALWSLLNLLGIWFAVRVFGGRPIYVLAGYQVLNILYYGQISGLLAGGLALLWWGIVRCKWELAGLGLLLAVTKYQVGVMLGLILIWYGVRGWRDFLRILVVPLLAGLATLAIYPQWPAEFLGRLSTFPFTHLGITFWNIIGPWALVFWLPALLLPLSRHQRMLALVSLSAFAVPYFLQVDLITLFAFPIGWIPLVGWLGAFFPIWGMAAVHAVVLAPFLCYLGAIAPGVKWIIPEAPA